MPLPEDPTELLRRLSESYRGIKFGRGVVGKTSYATLALFGLWGIILFRLNDAALWLDGLLLAAGVIVTAVYFWWVRATQRFAKENPSLALLEGTEFVEYEKWEAEIKGGPKPTLPMVPNPPALPHGPPG